MISMKGKVFIDTNVLIYLFSTDEPEKEFTVTNYSVHWKKIT